MILAGVIAMGLLTVGVCSMWAYTALQAELERRNDMEKIKFWYGELKTDQHCNVCGKTIQKGRIALIFKNLEAEHIPNKSRVRICSECASDLETLLKEGKVI